MPDKEEARASQSAPATKRRYRGTVQAEVAALTRQRILDAALALYAEKWIDEVTLEQVAAGGGVTVQTVIRHFGSKEGLFEAAAREAYIQAQRQRDKAPAGDIAGAVRNLVEHYEEVGDRVLRALAQEERYPALRPMMDAGRRGHRAWVERTLHTFLASHDERMRERLLAELVAVTDVYVWKLLRRDLGLSRAATEHALQEMVSALLAYADRAADAAIGE